jgi:endonuclease YncB( thermonuclease family)
VQITTITLKRFDQAAISLLLLVLASILLVGCEQVASVVSQTRAGQEAPAVSFIGRVVGITDGDTITVLDEQNQQHTIRLAEIDAPERGQPWGDRARQGLSALVFEKSVSVQQTDTDRYGRVVARVFSEGRDVNRAMVEEGAAWAYREYLTDDTLIATEARARQSRVGLWSMSDTQTVAPWEWRQGVRVGSGATDPAPSAPVRSLFTPGGETPAAPAESQESGSFSCSGKRYCRQMTSCAEANFYLRQCGVGSLDGDSDGRPCEVLCGG